MVLMVCQANHLFLVTFAQVLCLVRLLGVIDAHAHRNRTQVLSINGLALKLLVRSPLGRECLMKIEAICLPTWGLY